MALDPVTLDDLTWGQFTASASARIPAASGGRWTLLAPVDPGVTLLELFAWLLEQRLYWMDQVADPLTRALLRLLDIPANDAQAATAVLYAAAESGSAVPFAKGTEVEVASGLNPPVFTTEADVMLYPLAANGSGRLRTPRIKLVVGGQDRSDDLAQSRPTALFAGGGDTQIVLTLAAAPPQGTLGLFFDLLMPPGVAPGWAPDAPSGPAGPVPLTWLCAVNGTLTPLAAGQIQDSTLGLRRSGVVQLPIPSGWSPESGTTNQYAIVLRGASTGWTTPPRVTRIVPNVVAAVHRRKPRDLDAAYVKTQLKMWRHLPGNVFVLPEGDRPALASSLDVRIQEQSDTTAQPWQRVDDFNTSGPGDHVYVFDAAASRLRFGDGVAGKIPMPVHTSAVTVGYDVGGGTAGNVGNALAWETTAPPLLRLTNLVPGTGGTNAETPTDVRARAPALLRWTGRAILASDFETVALQAPVTALARAHAAVGSHPLFPSQVVPGAVTVFIVPDVPRNADDSPSYGTDQPYPAGPVADPPTLDAVLAALNGARLVTSEVYVRPAPYRPVFINVTIAASPADPQALRDAVVQALQRYLDPLVGGDDGTGWPFGGSLRPSSLIRIVQQAAGHAGTVRSVGIILDDRSQPAESCKDVPIQANELVTLQQVNIALALPSVGQGGLR
jgi:hypothetical protein